jgi:hypothetical protein
MSLLWLFIVLMLAGFVYSWVHPFISLPVAAPLAWVSSKGEPNRPLFYTALAIAWAWQLYILLAWCVVALALTNLFSSRPQVTHHWVYFIMGFWGCLAPVQYMQSFDHGDARQQLKGVGAVLLTATAFIAFAYVPTLSNPWNWLPQRFGLHRPDWSADEVSQVHELSNSVKHFHAALQILTRIEKSPEPEVELPEQEHQKMLSEFEAALDASNRVSDAVLDKFYPQMKVHYRREFQTGLRRFTEGAKEGDFRKQIEGQKLLDDWIGWCDPHVDAINRAIDKIK